MNGLKIWWYDNGNVNMLHSFNGDKPCDIFARWTEDGKLWWTMDYNKMEGKFPQMRNYIYEDDVNYYKRFI